MGKIGLIIRREIMAKLKNKTFIFMTFFAPVLVAGFFALMIWITMTDKTEQDIVVVDETRVMKDYLAGNDYISFSFTKDDLQTTVKKFNKSEKTAILWIPPNLTEGAGGHVKLFYQKTPSFSVQTYIKSQIEKILYEQNLKANNIDPVVIHNAKLSIKLIPRKIDETGREIKRGTQFAPLFGFFTGLLMFMFIMIYGMMVFRSVMEEKTSRIVEIIISSVKPIQLMLGKILGIAILGIMQFMTMGIITFILISVLSATMLGDVKSDLAKFKDQQELVKKHGTNINLESLDTMYDKQETFDILNEIQSLNFTQIFISFFFYFLVGFLFYSSIMAAIGSAVDTEADSQQFMMPIMLPMIAGYIIAVQMIGNPEGKAAMWGSFIPFTSPIVMMARLPNGVPPWQIYVSLAILILSFLGTAWLAAKIYRTGILMYGKKTSWREIMKWVFYK